MAVETETTLRGHAALFNSVSEDLGGFREVLERGAFRQALAKSPDVRLLLNHDSNFVLARTASGTLTLREENQGLLAEANVDRSIGWVDGLRTSMKRGDISNMSFSFTLRQGGDDWLFDEQERPLRVVRRDGVDELYDVSVVTFPAYKETSVVMRARHGGGILCQRSAPAGRIEDRRVAGSVSLTAARRRAKVRVLHDRIERTPTPLPLVALGSPVLIGNRRGRDAHELTDKDTVALLNRVRERGQADEVAAATLKRAGYTIDWSRLR